MRVSLQNGLATIPLNLAGYRSGFSTMNRLARVLWGGVWATLFRCSPVFCFAWRSCLLRVFGARIARGVHVYPDARIWAPWKLVIGEHSCLGPHVDCYNVAAVEIGAHVIVSQYSYLCTASHDDQDPGMRLVVRPIRIADGAWICADAFVGPGVCVGEGAVLGARSSAFRDLSSWKVYAGTPARVLRDRVLKRDALSVAG